MLHLSHVGPCGVLGVFTLPMRTLVGVTLTKHDASLVSILRDTIGASLDDFAPECPADATIFGVHNVLPSVRADR
jgi:hypothetical protein